MEGSTSTAAAALGFSSLPQEPEKPGPYALYKRTTIANIHRAYGGEDAFLATGFAKILELEGGDVERAHKTMDEIILTDWNAVEPEIHDFFEDAASRHGGWGRSENGSKDDAGPPTPPVSHHDASDASDTDDDLQIGLLLAKMKSRETSSGKASKVAPREANSYKPSSAGKKVQGNQKGPVKEKKNVRELRLGNSDDSSATKAACREEAVSSGVPASSTTRAEPERSRPVSYRAQIALSMVSSPASETGGSDADKESATVDTDEEGGREPDLGTIKIAATTKRSESQRGVAPERGRCRVRGVGLPPQMAGPTLKTGLLPTTKDKSGKRCRSNGRASSPTKYPSKSRARKFVRKSAPPPTTPAIRLEGLPTASAQANVASPGAPVTRASNNQTRAPRSIASTRDSPGVVANKVATATGTTTRTGSTEFPVKRRASIAKESGAVQLSGNLGAGSGPGAEPVSSGPPAPAPISGKPLRVRSTHRTGNGIQSAVPSLMRSTRTDDSTSPAQSSMSAVNSPHSGSPAGAVTAILRPEECHSKKTETQGSIARSEENGALVVLNTPKHEDEAESVGGESSSDRPYGSMNPAGSTSTTAAAITGSTERGARLTKWNKDMMEGNKAPKKTTETSTTTRSKTNSKAADTTTCDQGHTTAQTITKRSHNASGQAPALVVSASWTAVSVTIEGNHAEGNDDVGRVRDVEEDAPARDASGDRLNPLGGKAKAQGSSRTGRARKEDGSPRAALGVRKSLTSREKKRGEAVTPGNVSEEPAGDSPTAAAERKAFVIAAYEKARVARRRLAKRAKRRNELADEVDGATSSTPTDNPHVPKETKRIAQAAGSNYTKQKGSNRANPGFDTREMTRGTRSGSEADTGRRRSVFGVPCEKKAAIEVLWEVEDKRSGRLGGETKMDWFNAFVDLESMRGNDETGCPEWNILYPERRSPFNKFLPIRRKTSYVVFLTKDTLRDAESDEPLRWRKKATAHKPNTTG